MFPLSLQKHLNLFGDNPKSIFCDDLAMKNVFSTNEFNEIKASLCALSDEEALIMKDIFLNHLSTSEGRKEVIGILILCIFLMWLPIFSCRCRNRSGIPILVYICCICGLYNFRLNIMWKIVLGRSCLGLNGITLGTVTKM